MIDNLKEVRIIDVPEFHVSFPTLFTPRAVADFTAPKYYCGALFPERKDIRDFREEVYAEEQRLIEEHFGGKDGITSVLHSSAKSRVEYLQKYIRLSMSSKIRPVVKVIRDGKKYYAKESDILAGDICTAEMALFAYNSNGHKGIAASLLSVTKVREMEVSEEQAAIMADIDNVIERVW